MIVLPPSSFDAHSKEELIAMLRRAEARILHQDREHSIDGGIFVRDGDLANLKEDSRRAWMWSSSTKEVSSKLVILPRLPNEILRAIAYECDNETLTSLAQTSLVWLEIATPILYEIFVPRSRKDFENFVDPIYSPTTLLPQLSLNNVIHLIIPVAEHSRGYGRDSFKFNKEEEDEINLGSRTTTGTPPTRKFPLLSFPNLQTLDLSISAAVNPSYTQQVVMAPVLDLLASLNPKHFTFSSTGLRCPRWMLRENVLTRCLFAWTNLEVVTCRNVNLYFDLPHLDLQEPGVHLFKINPASYASKSSFRFIWDVADTGIDQLGLVVKKMVEDGVFSAAWNKGKGALEILVAEEEDIGEMLDYLRLDQEEEEEVLAAMVNVVALKEEDKADRQARLTLEERWSQELKSSRELREDHDLSEEDVSEGSSQSDYDSLDD